MRPLTLRNKLLVGCILALTVVATVVVALWPREPVYEGKRLSYWLNYLPVTVVSSHDHSSIWRASQYEVATFTSLTWMPQPQTVTIWSNGAAFAALRTSFPIVTIPPDSDGGVASPVSAIADRAVIEMGTRALPTLLQRLRTRERHTTRLDQTLHGWLVRMQLMEPALPPALAVQIKRGQAVTALIRLGDTVKPALPAVVKLAKDDPDPGVRASACEVLRRLSPADYATVAEQTNCSAEARGK
jgi:hypothetical protein